MRDGHDTVLLLETGRRQQEATRGTMRVSLRLLTSTREL